MGIVETACPACKSTVALSPDEILLGVRPQQPATYLFVCSHCGRVNAKRADAAAEGLLRTLGVTPWAVPELHPEPVPVGPRLGLDDLLDFHLLLAAEDDLSRLAAEAGDVPCSS